MNGTKRDMVSFKLVQKDKLSDLIADQQELKASVKEFEKIMNEKLKILNIKNLAILVSLAVSFLYGTFGSNFSLKVY